MIYFTSDLHFFHDKEFIYGPRGFSSEEEMRECYVKKWKNTVLADDDVYVLGDFCLGKDLDAVKDLASSLPGRIHLIIGNHDTEAKLGAYAAIPHIVEVYHAATLCLNGRRYFLCHYPTITSNMESDPKRCTINLFGHTHSKERFYEERPFMINVAADANGMALFLTSDDIERIFDDKVCEDDRER